MGGQGGGAVGGKSEDSGIGAPGLELGSAGRVLLRPRPQFPQLQNGAMLLSCEDETERNERRGQGPAHSVPRAADSG